MGDKDAADGRERPGYPHEVLAVLFRVHQRRLQVLLWQRAEEPALGRWALPGGLLAADERLGTTLARLLARKVDVHTIAHLEQLETRSDPDRDPRGRTLATAYLGLVPADVDPAPPADTRWWPVDRLPSMAFDHGSLVRSAVHRLRAKLSYTNIAFALAPREFTLPQLREVYTAVLGYHVSTTNLSRVLSRRNAIQRTGTAARTSGGVGRPPATYQFTRRELVVTDEFAAFRPGPDLAG